MGKPSLIVVGTGLRIIGQLTTETIAWIKEADVVLYLVYDPVAAEIIEEMNPRSESLAGSYVEGKPRKQSYEDMVGRIMDSVRAGRQTCVVLYGHAGIFCWPGHEAIRRARSEGYSARMLPSISTEDCLFADLGLDPATTGCQSYEAMDFLKNRRKVDASSLLILWQIGVMGDPLFKVKGYDLSPLPLLVKRLRRDYRPGHEVLVYVAPFQWDGEPFIQRLPLAQLARAELSASSTLCVPPGKPGRPDLRIYKRFNQPLPVQRHKRVKARSKRLPSGTPKPVQAFQPGRAR